MRTISWISGFVGVALILLGIVRSHAIYSFSGSVDLRNRVVAARQANLGLNPYTFKWNPSYPDTLLDPSEERDAKYSRMTSPPTVLWIHSFFADLPWPTQKRGNFILNWIAFFLIPLTVFLALRKKGASPGPLAGALVFGTGITAISGIWQFHLERAQQYSFLTLLLTLAVFIPSAGINIASGLAGALRPTLGFTLFLSFREKRVLRTALIISALGLAFLIPVLIKYPLSWWLDYFASSKDWYLHRQGMHERIPVIGSFTFPLAPEGDDMMSRAVAFGAPGNIFHHYLMKLGFSLIPYSVGMLTVIIASLVTVWKLWKNRSEDLEGFALRFLSSIYVVDLLLPSPRSAYNGVLFFPVLLVSVYSVVKWDKPRREQVFPCIALAGAAIGLGAIASPYSVPHLVETCYFVAATGFLLRRPCAPKG